MFLGVFGVDINFVNRYIAIPLAITVFNNDRDKFRQFKMRNIYLDMTDSAVEGFKKEFHALKREMISKHHVDIKRIDALQYNVNGEIIEYTADQLRDLAKDVMHKALSTWELKEINIGWFDDKSR